MGNFFKDWVLPAAGWAVGGPAGAAAVGAAIGMSESQKQAARAQGQTEEQIAQQDEWMNKMWQYQQPLAQSAVQTNAMMDPIRRQQAGQLANIQGMEPGSYLSGGQPSSGSGGGVVGGVLRAIQKAGGGGTGLLKGPPTVNVAESLPSWMQTPELPTYGELPGLPTYQDLPDVDALVQQLQGANDVATAQLYQKLKGQMTGNLQARGLGGDIQSTTGSAMAANVPLWMKQQGTLDRSNLAQTAYGLNMNQAQYKDTLANQMYGLQMGQTQYGDTRANQQFGNQMNSNMYMQNVATNLQNQLSGAQGQLMPMIDTSQYANAAANQANYYNQQAQGYGQQGAGYAQNLGNILGNWWTDYQSRQQAANTMPNAGAGTNTSAFYWPSQAMQGAQNAANTGLQMPGTPQQPSPFAKW